MAFVDGSAVVVGAGRSVEDVVCRRRGGSAAVGRGGGRSVIACLTTSSSEAEKVQREDPGLSRREALWTVCGGLVGGAAGWAQRAAAAEEVLSRAVESYGLAIDCQKKLEGLEPYIVENRLDEMRALFRSDPLAMIRRSCFYLANSAAKGTENQKRAMTTYKALIASIEELDHEALLVSRKQSKTDLVALLAKVNSRMDELLTLVPNPMK